MPMIGAAIVAIESVVTAVGTAIVGAAASVGAAIAGEAGATLAFDAVAGIEGALGGFAGALAGSAGIGAALSAWSSVAGVASLLIGMPHLDTGAATAFKADVNAPLPYVVGRSGTGGNIVFADVSTDASHHSLYYYVVLSHGPIDSVEQFSANNIPLVFNPPPDNGIAYVGANWRGTWLGTTAYAINDGVAYLGTDYIAIQGSLNIAPPNIDYWAATTLDTAHAWIGNMFQYTRLGAQPETTNYVAGVSPPEIDPTFALSGLAHAAWALDYTAKAYSTGTPKPMWVVRGPHVYDPRADSTYPGGSGTQRADDETTWAWSENPFLHGLAWLLGRKNNGVKVLGLGLPTAAIDLAAFVAGANVCDANGWKVGGVVTAADSKWQVLTAMLQAGGGAPMRLGALVSCLVETPVVSIATLTGADFVGPASCQSTVKRADRINRVVPKWRSEAAAWSLRQAPAVTAPAFATVDGGDRTKQIDYPLVQQIAQASQLGAYAIYDSREFGPITLPLKPQWMGLQPGDGVTIDEPELGLASQLCLVVDRTIDPAQGAPTLTLRSETTSKHAACLAVTAANPVLPTRTGVDATVAAAPAAGVWTATGTTIAAGGVQIPAIVVTGAADNLLAGEVIVEYSTASGGPWSTQSAVASATSIAVVSVAPGVPYYVQVSYLCRGVLSPATACTGSPATPGASVAGGRVYVAGEVLLDSHKPGAWALTTPPQALAVSIEAWGAGGMGGQGVPASKGSPTYGFGAAGGEYRKADSVAVDGTAFTGQVGDPNDRTASGRDTTVAGGYTMTAAGGGDAIDNVAASATVTFSGAGAAGDSVTVNGVAFDFVASGASGTQVNVGASAAATAANLSATINANSTSGGACGCGAIVGGAVVTVAFNTTGTGGDGTTLAASGAAIAVSGNLAGGTSAAVGAARTGSGGSEVAVGNAGGLVNVWEGGSGGAGGGDQATPAAEGTMPGGGSSGGQGYGTYLGGPGRILIKVV